MAAFKVIIEFLSRIVMRSFLEIVSISQSVTALALYVIFYKLMIETWFMTQPDS